MVGGGSVCARVPAQAVIRFIQDIVRLHFLGISYQILSSPADVVSLLRTTTSNS